MAWRGALWGLGGVALTASVAGVVLGLRPGSPPEAAVQSTVQVAAAPVASRAAVARLGALALEADELTALPAESREQLREDRPALEAWIRGRLAEKALLQQAEAQGWEDRPEIRRMTRAATEQVLLRTYLEAVSQVPEGYPSDAELQAAYDAGKANWTTPPMLRVAQIFLAVGPERSEEQVRKQAQDLARRARAEGADFAALARQHSEDRASAEQGGDSGLQPLQQYLPAMRQVLLGLKPGAVSDPVRSQDGYHVLRVLEAQPSRTATLDEVRGRLRDALRAQRQQQVARAYLDGLVNAGTLSIDGAQISQALETAH
ncbi:peptidylprolyl isomerase [Pseudomonas sp. 1D4]|uniref:peptidylprolyl isomerase n=1 Tax=Pseudomonas sp. 1D4 TaxID=1843691 RepID=UPI00084B4AB4|nr:peptidylprolyl isomerase [Pseudomonas sp. 1D4]OEC38049.1 peptidylprolyl isomerase [Pseudomonas sp. 1D4]